MKSDISADFGFELLRQRQATKLALDAAGREERVSLAKALIRSGVTDTNEILEEVVKITGGHVWLDMENLLHEEIGTHWVKLINGGLHVAGD